MTKAKEVFADFRRRIETPAFLEGDESDTEADSTRRTYEGWTPEFIKDHSQLEKKVSAVGID